VVDEMERFFRIDDRVMKYMTIVTAEDVDPEALLAEKAAAAAAAAVPAETVVEETAPETEATEADTTVSDEEE
jgi:small subunit ribosomal protein S6